MHITPKTNWMPHASEDPLERPLTIERQVQIAQKTQAAPKAWKKYWNNCTTLMTVFPGVAPRMLLAFGAIVGVYVVRDTARLVPALTFAMLRKVEKDAKTPDRTSETQGTHGRSRCGCWLCQAMLRRVQAKKKKHTQAAR